MLQAGSIKLSKVANTSKAIVRKETIFVDVMKALVNYVRAFILHYEVSFDHPWIKNIFNDTMSSGLIPMQSHVMYILYVLFPKFSLKNEQFLPLLERLKKKQEQGRPWQYRIWTAICCMDRWTKT